MPGSVLGVPEELPLHGAVHPMGILLAVEVLVYLVEAVVEVEAPPKLQEADALDAVDEDTEVQR